MSRPVSETDKGRSEAPSPPSAVRAGPQPAYVSLDLGALGPFAQLAWVHLVSTALRRFRRQDEAVIRVSGLHQSLASVPPAAWQQAIAGVSMELADSPALPAPDEEFVFLADAARLSRKLLRRFSRLYVAPAGAPTAIDSALFLTLRSQPGGFEALERVVREPDLPELSVQLSSYRDGLVPAVPRVTLITSIFDGDLYLPQFLENVATLRGYNGCEHLLVRAGSPGREHEPLLSHVRRHPAAAYINLPQDPGLYEVWNLGVRMATGQYLSNANLDDRRAPGHLERLCAELDGRPDIDVASSPMRIAERPNVDWKDSDGCQVMFARDAGRRYDARALFKEVDGRLQARDLPHCMPVWRRELHARHGFFDEAACGASADWEFWLRAGEAGAGFLMVSEPLGVFLRDPSCYSRRDVAQADRDAAIAERYRHLAAGRPGDAPARAPADETRLHELYRDGAALELVVQLAQRAAARGADETNALVRQLTGLPGAEALTPLRGIDRRAGAPFWGQLREFVEGVGRLPWGTGDEAVSPATALPVLTGLCMDALEVTGDTDWLVACAGLLGASGDEAGQQAVLRQMGACRRALEERRGTPAATAPRPGTAGGGAKGWILQGLRRLARIRNTRLWPWLRPVYGVAAALPGVRRLAERLVHGGQVSVGRLPRPFDRGPAPTVDHAALVRDYEQRGFEREPDTFLLYRIIGNDLVPRHRRGQSRENVAWMLQHEPELSGCEKRWVVNRIADPDEEAAIIELLEGAGQPYLHIPFRWSEYERMPWDILGVPPEFAPWTRAFARLSEAQQGRVLMRLYRHKNNYVMNTNGARNAALEDGRRRGKWVLPWDGNCFLTEAGWASIRDGVAANPEYPFHVVPMARVTDNSRLFDPGFRPEANEEPQILFRRDATLRFDEAFHYGRREKVELLWRLGVPGVWDQWVIEPWDLPCPAYARQAGAFARHGWVARLFSGRHALETGGSQQALRDRGTARAEAIGGLLDALDDKVDRQRHNARELRVLANVPGDAEACPRLIADALRHHADAALERGPYAVVDKTTLPPSGDPHDYWHPAPYYWPHPLRLPGLAYVRRDGRRVPGTRMYEPVSERYDRTRLQRLFDDTLVLALAWRVFRDERYARHGATLVRIWFLEPDTAMNPHLRYAQVRRGHNRNQGSSSGLIEMKDLYYFLDGVRILQADGFLNTQERTALADWFGRYLHWLRTSEQGVGERAATNNHGTYYDLQVAAIAAFLGEWRVLRLTLRDSRSRILQQFAPDGRQPEELARTASAHYCCFNLQGWIHLAALAERGGEDLWSFTGTAGEGIKRGAEWLLGHVGQPWPYEQIEEFDVDRFLPVYHWYRQQYGGPLRFQVTAPEDVKPVFHPHDGICPFWQFGLSLSAPSGRVPIAGAKAALSDE